jgi:pimeloyl-ACP methyl ester carboxylesterase
MHVPETKYARNGDVFLAYQVLGDGLIDLVLIPPGASHLEHWWEMHGTGSWLRQLASFSRLIIFDKRGNGLSDRGGGTASMDERVDDLRAVMDAAGSERAVLYGVSEGGPMSIVFAAARPERTLGLVLYATGARFAPDVDYEVSPM